MNELKSLNQCARLLGLQPMTLSRWVKRFAIPVLVIDNPYGMTYGMRPNEVRAALEKAGKLPLKKHKRLAKKKKPNLQPKTAYSLAG